jgi:hypothetical protein
VLHLIVHGAHFMKHLCEVVKTLGKFETRNFFIFVKHLSCAIKIIEFLNIKHGNKKCSVVIAYNYMHQFEYYNKKYFKFLHNEVKK